MNPEFEELEEDFSSASSNPKIKKLNLKLNPLVAKFLYASGVLVVLLVVLPVLGALLSNKPQKIGKPIVVKPPEAQISKEQAKKQHLALAREQKWDSVISACQVSLKDEFANLDEELQLARGQRWQAEARLQATKQKGVTEYQWLIAAYLAYSGKLQQLTKTGQIQTDAKSATDYRKYRGIILDIATALSSSGFALRPNVPTAELNDAVDSCYSQSVAYEQQRSNRDEIGGDNSSEKSSDNPQDPSSNQQENQQGDETP